MHRIRADQQQIGAAAFQSGGGFDHRAVERRPVAFRLQGGNRCEVERVQDDVRGVQPAEAVADGPIEQAIIFGRAFPAQTADQADGFHGANPAEKSLSYIIGRA